MNKFRYILFFVISSISIVSFVSCTSSENEEMEQSIEEMIIGKWLITSADIESCPNDLMISFDGPDNFCETEFDVETCLRSYWSFQSDQALVVDVILTVSNEPGLREEVEFISYYSISEDILSICNNPDLTDCIAHTYVLSGDMLILNEYMDCIGSATFERVID